MTSAINPANPVYGSPTTQSVRDNFQHAHDEITALQAAIPTLLPLGGGTMTGPIVLAADPAAAMQAATRQYVDNKVAAGVVSFNTRTGQVVLQAADVTGVGGALLASPNFSGTPTAPTAPPGTNTTQLASTAFVAAAVTGSVSGVASFNTRTGAVTLQAADVTGVGGALLASPTFTGNPAAPTAPAGQSNTQIATTAFVQTSVGTALHNVGRNYVHNPLFNIAQRGVGPFTAIGYALDRMWIQYDLGSLSVSQITLTDADRAAIGDESAEHAFQAVVVGNAGAASFQTMQHPIEDVRRLSGKTVTLSFWAKAASGTPKLGLGLVQYFGGAGSPSAPVYVPGQAVTLSTTWARYSITAALPSVAGKVMGTDGTHQTDAQFWFSAGSSWNADSGSVGVQSGTFTLWGVQLEIGSVATPLEKPDPQQDLANCQRFYQDSSSTSSVGISVSGYTAAGGALYGNVSFPVRMRAVPTITPLNEVLNNVTGPAYAGCNDGLFIGASGTTTNQFSWSTGFTASADL
jgi:hypothetical protein